jgi:hypothetical protein
VNTIGVTGAVQQQQGSTSQVSAAGRCSTLISFLNVHNYESLFNFWILYINVAKRKHLMK